MKKYTKRPISIIQQIELLKERGLHFLNEEEAMRKLDLISYFRLANYWKPMEQDKSLHKFKSESTFENVINLYFFDKELRLLVFSALQTIEIALRTKIIHHVSLKYGSFWFTDETLFINRDIFEKCLRCLKDELLRSKEDFLFEHYSKYNNPLFPPAWKTLEISSFGTLSKLYCNLSDVKLKKKIANEFGLPQHLFMESWVKCLTVLRNCIAHHARIWNRKFPWKPRLPHKLLNPWIEDIFISKEKLYAQLCCIAYMLDSLAIDSDFKKSLVHLLECYPNVDVWAMGFPLHWKEELLWQISKHKE